MIRVLVVVGCLGALASASGHGGHSTTHRQQDPHSWKFGYHIVNGYGAKNGREEHGVAYGPVSGSYYLGDIDGRHRTVHYVADKGGFRAQIKTNEPGTKTSHPAAAHYHSANGKHIPSGSHGYGHGHHGHGLGHHGYGHGHHGHGHHGHGHHGHGYHGHGHHGYGHHGFHG